MQKARSTTTSNPSKKGKKSKTTGYDRSDPFAVPPNPLGYRALTEERPLRASRFGSVLPSIAAKYGLGRKLGVERFNAAWRDALATVFDADSFMDFGESDGSEGPSKLETYAKYARPVAFRGGVLRIELASNLLLQELQFYLASLLRELQTRLPEEKIEKIKLSVRR